MPPIRVVVADDHPSIRAGMTTMLETVADIRVVGQASDGIQALHMVAELAPDVLLLDIEMPALSGYEVSRQLRTAHSPVRILAFSAHSDAQHIVGILNNGASSFLSKDASFETIIASVRGLMLDSA